MKVDEWVELFHEIGLDEPQMHKWHAAFERRYPDSHQSFLEWLNFTPDRITEVRHKSAEEWSA
jgi:hypothetical protein